MFTDKTPTFAIIVPESSAIRDAKDVRGIFAEMPPPLVQNALTKGTIAASTANEPWLTYARENGFRVIPQLQPILAKYIHIPQAIIERMSYRGMFAETWNPAIVQPEIDAAAKLGRIPQPFPASELYVALSGRRFLGLTLLSTNRTFAQRRACSRRCSAAALCESCA